MRTMNRNARIELFNAHTPDSGVLKSELETQNQEQKPTTPTSLKFQDTE